MNNRIKPEIEYRRYQKADRHGVINLICSNYGRMPHAEEVAFSKFYETEYQSDTAILIVACHDHKIVGFQSYFRWPYQFDGHELNTYQSGNSIVHADYRGLGIFKELLNFPLTGPGESLGGPDLLVGFPAASSYGSFLRNGWKNPFNLKWLVKIVAPISGAMSPKINHTKILFDMAPAPISSDSQGRICRLSQSNDFLQWRAGYQSQDKRSYHNAFHPDGSVRLDLKVRRRRLMNELIIGDIVLERESDSAIQYALRTLLLRLSHQKKVSFVSVAVAETDRWTLQHLETIGFKEIKKQIPFITKVSSSKEVPNAPPNFRLFRSDMDTW